MAANAWIMTAYTTEAESSGVGEIDYVMGISGSWVAIEGDLTRINNAAAYVDGAFPVEEVRRIQGDFQQKYIDRDVRMERVTLTITYPPTP